MPLVFSFEATLDYVMYAASKRRKLAAHAKELAMRSDGIRHGFDSYLAATKL